LLNWRATKSGQFREGRRNAVIRGRGSSIQDSTIGSDLGDVFFKKNREVFSKKKKKSASEANGGST